MNYRALSILILFFVCPARAALDKPVERPRLVVVVTAQGLSMKTLRRCVPLLGRDGFGVYLSSGVVLEECRFKNAALQRSPGHASIATGQYPNAHGIVANQWYFREIGQMVLSIGAIQDPSAGFLAAPSLGERLRKKFPRSRVVSIALEPEAAWLMGGVGADTVVWWDENQERFVSSDPSADRWLPGYNAALKDGRPDRWEMLRLIPPGARKDADAFDAEFSSYKSDIEGMGRRFPHPVGSVSAFLKTPFANDWVLGMTEKFVDSENLGAGMSAGPDLLWISLSSLDWIGHLYGPGSPEMLDGVVRLDLSLQALHRFLRQRIGDRGLVLCLVSDHGIGPIPEEAAGGGVRAGRLALYDAPFGQTIRELPPLRQLIERRLCGKFGVPYREDVPVSDAWVRAFSPPYLYLNHPRLVELGFLASEVRRELTRILEGIEGIQSAISSDDLNSSARALDYGYRAAALNQFADRSGDVALFLKPHFVWKDSPEDTTGARHDSIEDYDTHVPLMFWAASLEPRQYRFPSSPLDLAATLCALLELDRTGLENAQPMGLIRKGQTASQN